MVHYTLIGDSLICNITYSKSWISRSHYNTIFLDIAPFTKLVKWNISTLTEWNNCWIHNIFFVMTQHDINISNKFLNFFDYHHTEKRQLKCRRYYCSQRPVQVKFAYLIIYDISTEIWHDNLQLPMHVFGCKMIMDGLWIDFHALVSSLKEYTSSKWDFRASKPILRLELNISH